MRHFMDSYLGQGVVLIDHRTGAVHDRTAILTAAGFRAGGLETCGVSRLDRVVIAHGSDSAVLVDLLAIWSLGAAAVMVSKAITAPEKDNVLAATRAKAWIGADAPGGVAALAPAAMDRAGDPALKLAASLDDPALIMMTSGTTSQPKGVVLTHRAVQARIALNIAHIGRDDLGVALSVLPMHFGHGLIGNILTPMAAGARLVIWPEPGAAGLPVLGKVIDDHGVTFMSSVPSLWRVATRLSPRPEKGSLRRVHVGSAPLAAPLWDEICAWTGTRRVLNMYGITETSNWIGGWSAESGDLRDNLVGRPWGGSFRVVAADGSMGLAGKGEVAVNSPSVMAGYFERQDLSDAALKGDWFLTGDIGEIDADGHLTLVGRSKFEINKGGIKIPAEEIDALLERHPDIEEACAFSLPDSLSGETVAAAIVFKDGAVSDTLAIRQWCEEHIRREAVPSKLFVLPVLPRTDRGKLNRDVVREASLSPAGQQKG
jgi:acyl-CoA synthetase (AMP-forming)/AMP-acid ligase II